VKRRAFLKSLVIGAVAIAAPGAVVGSTSAPLVLGDAQAAVQLGPLTWFSKWDLLRSSYVVGATQRIDGGTYYYAQILDSPDDLARIVPQVEAAHRAALEAGVSAGMA